MENTLSSLFNQYISVTLTGKVIAKIRRSFPELLKDPLRFEGLLKDIYSTDNKKEIFLLTTALKARIIDHFQSPNYSNNLENGIESMIKKLTLEYGLEEKASKWVTIAWILGLELLNEEEFRKISSIMDKPKIKDNNNFFNVSTIFGRKNIISENVENDESYKINLFDENKSQSLTVTNPSNIDEWNTLGLAFHNQGKYQHAVECYNKALDIDPGNSRILSNKGLSFHNQGKYQHAVECYNKALDIDPNDEFIKKRKSQSIELIKRTKFNNNINNKQSKSIQVKKRANKTFFIGAILIIIFTSLGVGGYFFMLENNINGNLFSGNTKFNLITNNNSEKASYSSYENKDTSSLGSTSSDHELEKEKVSEYTNIIANAINNGSKISDTKQQLPIKVSEVPELTTKKIENENNKSLVDNSMADINLLQFKDELKEAMGSKFN